MLPRESVFFEHIAFDIEKTQKDIKTYFSIKFS